MLKRIRRKYIKPTSLTWLTGVVPLAIGCFISMEPVHHLAELVQAANTMTGGTPPAALITYGLTVIGLRGKDDV